MILPFTLILLAFKFTDVSQASLYEESAGDGDGFDEHYDEPLDSELSGLPGLIGLLGLHKQPNKIINFEALHSNQGIILKLTVANPDQKVNATVRDLLGKTLDSSQGENVLGIKQFQIDAFSCNDVPYDGEVSEITCHYTIQIDECADLFFALEGFNASARAISVSPGSVMLKQSSNETQVSWSIPCDGDLKAPLHLTIGDHETKEERRVTLEGQCSDKVCVSNIEETLNDGSNLLRCAIYDMAVDGYSENKVQFLHWTTTYHTNMANVIGTYSNQTLILAVTFVAEMKVCNENLRAVNVTSPGGFFDPQTIRCVHEEGDSIKRCSETVRITAEKLVCQPEITVSVLPIYGRNHDAASYAIEGGGAELVAVIEKEPEWDGGKSVAGLAVTVGKADITIEWEDPFCPMEGVESFSLTLTTAPLNSINELVVPAKCSKWGERNLLRIVNGKRLECQAGNSFEQTAFQNHFKLLSCVNYSLSVTPAHGVSKSISFVSPFQPQDITNVTSKATHGGFKLQWNMPESCPAATELTVQVNSDSHKVRPFETSGIGVTTTNCHLRKCDVTWKIARNLTPCNEFSVRIGSAQNNFTISPSIEDYLFDNAPLVNIFKHEHSLSFEFVINGTQKRCLKYLQALEVIFRQPYVQHEYKSNINCSPPRDTNSKVTCYQEVPFGYINACRNHSVSYRPRFSLASESATVWNNEDLRPLANSSKLAGARAMHVQSEHRDHISVKWKSPRCLFGSVARWRLSIETDKNTDIYSEEIPFNCSAIGHSSEDQGYSHSIQIRDNEIECHNGASHFVNNLELASCTIYRVKLWPIVQVSNQKSVFLKEFDLTETLSTDIDYNDVQDIRVVDLGPRSFNVELSVPPECARFNVKPMELKINREVRNTGMHGIESAGCTDDNCTLKFKIPLEAVPFSYYNVSIGNHSVEFTTSLEVDEGMPRNVTETTINEDNFRIKWDVAPHLKELLASWRLRVTNANSHNDIIDKNLPASETTVDIFIPYPNISAVDQASNESQKCPEFFYRLGAVWSGEIGDETSRTFWTESKTLNYTNCTVMESIRQFSTEKDYPTSHKIISLQLLVILCVSGGVLFLLIGTIAYVYYARKQRTWHVEN